MKQYRKARKGEMTCWDCCHRSRPDKWSNRIRCLCGRRGRWGPAVGRKMTCDNFYPREDNP